MSIWDYMKKADKPPAPTSVELAPDGRLRIAWDDGKETPVSPFALRAECPCAACIDEFTSVRTLDVSKIPPDIRVNAITQVGNYAVTLTFSDGHDTGIYSWATLRKIADARAG